MDIFNSGLEAYKSGKPRFNNPYHYKESKENFDEWDKGYMLGVSQRPPFDNKERHRNYGHRKGDIIKISYPDEWIRNPDELYEVSDINMGDNNRIEIMNSVGEKFPVVAEWYETVTKVEDREDYNG